MISTGYHRTKTELQDRKLLKETIFGSRVAIRFDRFKAAFNFMAYQYNIPVNESDKPYQLFEFKDYHNIDASIDYTWFPGKLCFFGETAISKNGALALLNGMIVKVVPQLSFTILHRYYQKNYHAYYSNSFSESSSINNEEGFYYGLVFHPARKLKISAYADMFSFPWLKYGVDAPSNGSEYFVQADYSLNRNMSMYFRWQEQTKKSNFSESNYIFHRIVEENKQNFRFHIAYQISQIAALRNRIELVQFKEEDHFEHGFMILQDLSFDFKSVPLSVDFRYCMFDATYNSRIYAYENDILNNYSIPAYSGRGSRIYFLAKYKFGKKLDLSIRYGQFLYADRKVIGSNNDEIQGNIKSELKLQMVYRF